ncbi:MAG: L-threonylcarbamoyladenylate synthase [Halieaceae bacterium]|jgi:L-threonylcarbamoyladenylate synthase|nr:L-threonylcarbamoyladenylate synthase [Halieaceae bacterium]
MTDMTPDIEKAIAALNAGELVAIPTETVYGLAADASSPTAVRKIFALKGRPPSRPLIVHLPYAEAIDRWASWVPDYARRWASVFWPGPLAMVLPRQSGVLNEVTGGQDTVALRVPDHPLTLALLEAFGGGLAAPSANRYGRISPTTAAHVRDEFGSEAPLILDGGPCRVGIESTIVSCLDDTPRILRPGSISAMALSQAAGVPVLSGAGDTHVVVPGQVASHYAPVTPTQLLPHGKTSIWAGSEVRAGFLGFHSPPFPVEAQQLLALQPEVAAQQLYAALRQLDDTALETILIEAPPSDPEWEGVWDRLRRACA